MSGGFGGVASPPRQDPGAPERANPPRSGVAEAAERAKRASTALARASTDSKNEALAAMAKSVMSSVASLLDANREDVEAASVSGISRALIDRLTLNERRIQGMADGLLAVAEQPDPVGAVIEEWTRPNGLRIQKVRAPLGVVAVIYEARPNVTADVAGLCLKSGNASLLRGSSQALATNRAVTSLLRRAVAEAGLPEDAIVLVENTGRDTAMEIMRLKGLVDLLVPRGGAALVR
ncbi:MAG: aldehyde dehydrogenase family protein, partial [Acidimicrobiales bacterium]